MRLNVDKYINLLTVYIKHIQLISTMTETLPASFMIQFNKYASQ